MNGTEKFTQDERVLVTGPNDERWMLLGGVVTTMGDADGGDDPTVMGRLLAQGEGTIEDAHLFVAAADLYRLVKKAVDDCPDPDCDDCAERMMVMARARGEQVA